MSDQTGYLWKDKKHHLWFPLSFTTYYIEDERLMIKEGILNTTLEETLLYRIVDLTFRQTLAGKIFGTGDIILKSQAIEESRHTSNVVGKEFYTGPSHEHMDLNDDGICDFDNTPM